MTTTFLKPAAALHRKTSPERAPRMCTTSGGVIFDSAADRWSYRDGIDLSLDFTSLVGVTDEFLDSAKRVLSWYAEERSPAHLKNMFGRLLHFTRTINRKNITSISSSDLLNYSSMLNPSTKWYLGHLRGLLLRWKRLGHPGVEDEAMLLFKQLRIQGNAQGVAVLTMDVDRGPFTSIEMSAIQTAVNDAYAHGLLSTSDFVHIWLTMLLGQRPTQHAALKVSDVIVRRSVTGFMQYAIRMPSAKKRLKDRRAAFKERQLTEQFGEILASYAESIQRKYDSLLPDPCNLPLFLKLRSKNGFQPGYEYHSTPNMLGRELTFVLEELAVISERTGEVMNICPVRFRRTIGTRAAEEGCGDLVIAELLDHANTQNVRIYSASTPEFIERIDRAIALDMAPIAQAFQGSLAERDEQSVNHSKHIVDLRIDRNGDSMGECGKHGYCGFNAPIACYTCRNFRAWLDGPHDAVLNYLLRRREKMLLISDKRIAAVNDRTILAVAQVIQDCEAAYATTAEGARLSV